MLLNLHSYYSLRHGTLSLDELLEGMLANGYDTAVLTDINNSTGSIDFIRKGQQAGLNILAGMEFRQDDTCCFIAIAQNERGFSEINAYRTQLNFENAKVPLHAPEFKEVFVIYPLQRMGSFALKDYEYIGIRPSERSKAILMDKQFLSKAVILAPVTFRTADHTFHRQLRAIDHNLLISQLSDEQVAPVDERYDLLCGMLPGQV